MAGRSAVGGPGPAGPDSQGPGQGQAGRLQGGDTSTTLTSHPRSDISLLWLEIPLLILVFVFNIVVIENIFIIWDVLHHVGY